LAAAGPRQRIWRALRSAGSPSVTATLRAMESAGVVRTLAEPNLTAISGESATFIAGGEFPIPAGYDLRPDHACLQCTQISFKKFGISLNFTPVVLSEGRISLRVMTEVSELSNDNAITLTRRSLDHGLADDSLDQDPPRRNHAGNSLRRLDGDGRPDPGADQAGINGLPGLAQLPVLGALFRSRTSSTTRPS
jgi:pilus assembly protein CpaC